MSVQMPVDVDPSLNATTQTVHSSARAREDIHLQQGPGLCLTEGENVEVRTHAEPTVQFHNSLTR